MTILYTDEKTYCTSLFFVIGPELLFKKDDILQVRELWYYVNRGRTLDILPHLDATAVIFSRLLECF